MELLTLDKDFNIVDNIYPTNIQWSRKYYECGTFSMTLPIPQYSDKMKYVYTKDREETGIINKVSYTTSSNGKRVQISGFFLEKMLDDRIAYPTFNGSGEITQVLTEYINKYKKDLPIKAVTSDCIGSKVDFQDTGSELSKKMYEVLETQEMSYKVIYDFVQNKSDVKFYQGLDRTQSQSVNNFITFSTKWGNLTDINANMDDSNEKNYFVIGGSGEGADRIYETLDLSNGGTRKEIFIDARDLTYDTKKQTKDQYSLELRQRGIEKALEHKQLQNFTFKPRGKSYEYLKDFDLGAKCDVMLEDVLVELEVRITAIYEVIKDNNHTIELEFGNQKIRRLRT